MAGSIIVWEAANLFAGDDGPNNSKHLALQSVQMPQLQEKTHDFHPGGGIGAISLGGFGIEALKMSFKLLGSDLQTKTQFGLGSKQSRPYTVYSVLRDKNGGRAIERKAIVWGRLSELSEQEFQRGNPGEQDHTISEVTHYELYEDKQEVYYYDFFASIWRVRGVDQLADVNAILRIN